MVSNEMQSEADTQLHGRWLVLAWITWLIVVVPIAVTFLAGLQLDNWQIMFSFQGRTFFEGEKGKQLLMMTLEAEDERYRWLKTSFCVLEGIINAQTSRMRARIYACVNDLI
jgi:hypothetical protein